MKLHILLGAVAFCSSVVETVSAQSVSDLATHLAGKWGVDLSDQDRSVRPGDNFYDLQNGGWLARTELRPNQQASAYWRDLRNLAPRRLVAILEAAAADHEAAPETPRGKVGAFYRAYTDEAAIEARGVAPLKAELDAIRRAATKAQLAELMGRSEGPGAVRTSSFSPYTQGRGLFRVDVAQDRRNPGAYAVYLQQGGLLLPGPEFYLEPQFADVRTAYAAYIAQMLELIGWPEADAWARQIIAFETMVAAASWSHEQMLDTIKTYNPMTVRELATLAPGFDWRAYLKGAELPDAKSVVIDARSAFPALAAAFANAPLDMLQARQAFAAADYNSRNLNAAAAEATYAFRNTAFASAAYLRQPRSVRAEQAAEAALNDIVGSFYVSHYSSPEAKAAVTAMANAERKAFDVRLQNLAWMSPAGKTEARAKLAAMQFKIGYPDRFDDYNGLRISADDAYGNVQRAAAYAWRRQIARLDKSFDRSEWTLTPEYPQYTYVPTTNTIEIPAALLQPPFFDLNADDAVNYGAAGSLVGEMITLGFTGQGIVYDREGRLTPGLGKDDMERLGELSRRVAAQYSKAEPLPGLHLKGELVMDEAVSDLGGVQIALDAYRASMKGRPAQVLDGYTGDQRFFLGRAQMWRAKFSEAFIRNQVATGSNAPPYMRINGPLPNIDAWYDAFGIRPQDNMYLAPENRIRIW